MNYIELDKINLNFKNQIIFKNANLSISHTGFYCLVGRNGTGKTTLFNVLTKRVNIDSGTVNIYKENAISYCDANSSLFNDLTVRENLLSVTNNLDNILNLLKEFHIERLIDASAKRLSEGERQRVAIIRTILEGKPIMLLDEVTSHIDDEITDIVLQYLSELSKTHIIIYATHYKKEVNKFANYVICIEDKKIFLEVKKDNYNTLKESVKSNYVPTKILNKIIRFMPDYFFSFIFIILTSISLLTLWFLTLSPNWVIYSVENKTINPKYSVIDDYSMNIFDGSNGSFNTGTNVDNEVKKFVDQNSNFKLGFKNYTFWLGNDYTNGYSYPSYVQYFLFDEDLLNYEIYCSETTYETLQKLNLVSNNLFTFRNVKANINIIKGNYYFDFLVTNEYTFKQIDKFNSNSYNTIEETKVHLVSGRLPENDDEIIAYSGITENINSTFTYYYANLKKDFTIVGLFDYVESSIYEFMPNYIVLKTAFDFKLEGNALLSQTYGFIAYGDAKNLNDNDINYILNNHLYIINDLIEESYKAYNNFKNIRADFIRLSIFVIVFDVLAISFYIVFWFNSNKDRYLALKILNRIKLIKKRCIIKKIILNFLISFLGISIYIILQNIINNHLLNECFNRTSIVLYQLTFINNKFLIITIPLLILIQSVITTLQLRRSLYD